MGLRRWTGAVKTMPMIAAELRSRAEQIPVTFAPFVRESSLTFIDRIMLRRVTGVIRRDAEAWKGNSEISLAARETFERVVRDADLVTQVLDRKSIQWSVYQREEILAIAARIGRSYRDAADGLLVDVP